MPRIWSGAAAAEARPQDESQATHAPKLRKEDAVLDFTKSAHDLANQVGPPSSKLRPMTNKFLPNYGPGTRDLSKLHQDSPVIFWACTDLVSAASI